MKNFESQARVLFEKIYGFEVELDVPITDASNFKKVLVSKYDNFNIYEVKETWKVYQGMFYDFVMAIGNFVPPDEHGLMRIEKCSCVLRCNGDFTPYDLELFFHKMDSW